MSKKGKNKVITNNTKKFTITSTYNMISNDTFSTDDDSKTTYEEVVTLDVEVLQKDGLLKCWYRIPGMAFEKMESKTDKKNLTTEELFILLGKKILTKYLDEKITRANKINSAGYDDTGITYDYTIKNLLMIK